MDLTMLGITKKQALALEALLMYGPLTVRQVVSRIQEQRTNCYLVLEQLAKLGFVEKDETHAVTQYKSVDPSNFRDGLIQRQNSIKDDSTKLTKIMPELTSLYRLTTQQKGISYFHGLKGYTAALHDMSTAKTDVLVIASDTITKKQPQAFRLLRESVKIRSRSGISSSILFSGEYIHPNKADLCQQNTTVKANPRLQTIDSEIAIYNNRVAITSYNNTLTTLINNDPLLVTSMTSIFYALWETGELL